MTRKFSYSEKGKAIALEQPAPPRLRIRARDMDTSYLIKDNTLTLVGRLTNPKSQRL